MANDVKLLDVVALTVDLPEYNLWRGQVGTVVENLEKAFINLHDGRGDFRSRIHNGPIRPG